jgi:hypothetical protein
MVNNFSTNFHNFWSSIFISKILLSPLRVLLNDEEFTFCCKKPKNNFNRNYTILWTLQNCLAFFAFFYIF